MNTSSDQLTQSFSLAFDTIPRVDEVVTDVLAMDLLYSSPQFLRRLLDLAGEPGEASIIAMRRSVFDTSLGETDIELVVRSERGRHAILIENKIRAPLMDRQFERYQMRGTEGIAKGKWDRVSIILMSPKAYFEALDRNHAQHINANLTYEAIVAFLADHPEQAFKRHVFLSAIADFKKGYQRLPDAPMMAFYEQYWSLASSEFPQLRMPRPGVVGKDGSWIYFSPLYGGGAKVRLIHKFKGIGCELGIATYRAQELAEAIEPLLDEDMVMRVTKSAAYVNLKAPPLKHLLPFGDIRDDAKVGLVQLERLRTFALRDEVRKVILAVI
ncbi:hypothetical protein [Devosia sp. YR412]|uniref:PD-(D/E)XK nuclease family protein n=1 Tax=Devosia sp. YR412 TaxID=1881030 RepID=UPI000B887159|nr:hypothetical protein [Devosia sp. YR412]